MAAIEDTEVKAPRSRTRPAANSTAAASNLGPAKRPADVEGDLPRHVRLRQGPNAAPSTGAATPATAHPSALASPAPATCVQPGSQPALAFSADRTALVHTPFNHYPTDPALQNLSQHSAPPTATPTPPTLSCGPQPDLPPPQPRPHMPGHAQARPAFDHAAPNYSMADPPPHPAHSWACMGLPPNMGPQGATIQQQQQQQQQWIGSTPGVRFLEGRVATIHGLLRTASQSRDDALALSRRIDARCRDQLHLAGLQLEEHASTTHTPQVSLTKACHRSQTPEQAAQQQQQQQQQTPQRSFELGVQKELLALKEQLQSERSHVLLLAGQHAAQLKSAVDESDQRSKSVLLLAGEVAMLKVVIQSKDHILNNDRQQYATSLQLLQTEVEGLRESARQQQDQAASLQLKQQQEQQREQELQLQLQTRQQQEELQQLKQQHATKLLDLQAVIDAHAATILAGQTTLSRAQAENATLRAAAGELAAAKASDDLSAASLLTAEQESTQQLGQMLIVRNRQHQAAMAEKAAELVQLQADSAAQATALRTVTASEAAQTQRVAKLTAACLSLEKAAEAQLQRFQENTSGERRKAAGEMEAGSREIARLRVMLKAQAEALAAASSGRCHSRAFGRECPRSSDSSGSHHSQLAAGV
ncbi:MAG: hypothetical protein WDW38_009012 [Sanguina aurantia]